MTQISPQIKLFALVGLLGALALFGGMTFMSRQAAAQASEPLPPIESKLSRSLASPAAAKPKATLAKAPAKAKAAKAAPAKAAPKPAAKPKPKLKPKPQVKLVEGLPAQLAAALRRSRVVVVALYAPDAPIDVMAMREAEAGAFAAGAGFVALDVLDSTQVNELVKTQGVMKAPATLVYTRPGTVAVRLDGFVDRQTVEQVTSGAS